jgi:hypothetical protein
VPDKVYSCDVQIAGTAYVKASNKTEAQKKLRAFVDSCIEVHGPEISDQRLDDPDLPEVSLSPAMTPCPMMPSGFAANSPADPRSAWKTRVTSAQDHPRPQRAAIGCRLGARTRLRIRLPLAT